MDDLLFYLVSICLSYVILYEAMGIFFNKKNMSCFMSAAVWAGFYFIEIFFVRRIDDPMLVLIFEIVCSLCLCLLLYYGSIRKKLIWIFVINVMGMITETFVGYWFLILDFKISQTVLGSFASKMILLMVFIGVRLSRHLRLKRDIPFKDWCILFCIPLGSIFVINTLFSLCEKAGDKDASVLAMLSSAFILGFNLLILHIYEHLAERMQEQKKQIIFNRQFELYKDRIREREESSLNIRNIKHDIENHLICIREYIEKDDLGCAKKYIDEMLTGENFFHTASVINSGNLVVDALLNYKYMEMKQLGIEMQSHIEIPYNMVFHDADICVILGNCLDNSIEAVEKIENEVQLKIISVELIYRKNTLILIIANPFTGELKQDRKGEYITTKTDAVNHGIGLSSVRKAVEKYDGLLEIEADHGNFKVHILLYSLGKSYI